MVFLFFGVLLGFVQKFCFVVVDVLLFFFKFKVILWIFVGGVVFVVIGFQIVIWLCDSLFGIFFVGVFLVIIFFVLISIVIFFRLKLLNVSEKYVDSKFVRLLIEIIGIQCFIIGMFCGIGFYVFMIFMMMGVLFVMVVGCGYLLEVLMFGIQWYVFVMFGLSFFIGYLIICFGVEKVVVVGFIVFMGCVVVVVFGIVIWNFWGFLILFGIGWNFGFIGLIVIVVFSYWLEEVDKVQGFYDIFFFIVVVLVLLFFGKVFNSQGWNVMVYMIWFVCLVCFVVFVMLVCKMFVCICVQ